MRHPITRAESKRRRGGGTHPGAGRPRKENHNPLSIIPLRTANALRRDQALAREHRLTETSALYNPRGRSWSLAECKILLCLIKGLMSSEQWTQTEALQKIARATRRSYSTLHHVYSAWREDGVILYNDTSARGGSSYMHINHQKRIPSELVLTIHTYIRTSNNNGVGCTAKEIASHIRDTCRITIAQTSLISVLHSMGYVYDYANIIGQINDVYKQERIRAFMIQYNRALQLQSAGTHIIVYTDESYVHTAHARSMTWFNPFDEEGGDVVRPSTKGIRLVILHAMTMFGLLHVDVSACDNVDIVMTSCELIYKVDVDAEDYHDNMNGNLYMKWLRNRLLPTFAARFPDKQMILVLDNARYHHVRDDDYIVPSKMNKPDIVATFERLGIECITVERRDESTQSNAHIKFDRSSFTRHGGANAPTLIEMKAFLTQYLIEHPQNQKTAVQKLFYQHDHSLIYTPPYTPQVQPIELVWAYVKSYVASQYKRNRTVTELIADTRRGFYGDGRDHAGLDEEACAKRIQHCHCWCDEWIERDGHLQGAIHDLVTDFPEPEIDTTRDQSEELDNFDDQSDSDGESDVLYE